jgi:putative ABC transport system ATP-binding protein
LDSSLFRFIWKHSRRQQLFVLLAVLASLPFYFMSFDIPKRIINQALQGQGFEGPGSTVRLLELSLPRWLGGTRIFDGFDVTQLGLLWGLSGLFLIFTIINGGFKYYINVMKGVVGERLLRRMRFILLDQYLRFRPEDIRGVKPSEAASIIKDEVDPVGGFAGEAFIQPAFLGMQALTALVFIMVQSLWLGMVALTVVLIQAAVIPPLRREQLRLTQLRQIESRRLAGRVGEIVETTPAIQVAGSGAYTRAEVGGRLATLFDIRVQLFKRKFMVKYINNLLAQVTPFFFYAIGGYLALSGSLSIGQLVAVIAAYRDLPPPIKELIDWDQQRADVTIKYQQIIEQFPTDLLPAEAEAAGAPIASDAPLIVAGLKVMDKRGVALLDSTTVTIPRPAHIALLGAPGSGRDALARVLGRQITGHQGRIALGDLPLDGARGLRPPAVAYAGPDPHVSSGSLRDNLLGPLLRPPTETPVDQGAGQEVTPAARRARIEAELSGTPLAAPDENWVDPAMAGVESPDALEARMMEALACTGLADDVYRFGLQSRIDPDKEPDLVARIPAARTMILESLAARDMTRLVEPLDPKAFNHHATLAENLLFGRASGSRFSEGRFASDAYLRSILEAESLLFPLTEIGLAMAETVIEVFAGLTPGDPLFERFSSISFDDMPEYQRLAEQARSRGGFERLPADGQSRFIELALTYVESQHRLQLVTPQVERRVLRARESFRRHLPQSYADDIEFYQPDRFMRSASLQDNLLFGRIAHDVPDAVKLVREASLEALKEMGLDRDINRLGLGFEVGPSGRFLQSEQRASLSISRALMPKASIVVLDGALVPFSPSEAREMLSAVRKALEGRTLVATMSDPTLAEDFDAVLSFEGPHMIESRPSGRFRPARRDGLARPDETEDPVGETLAREAQDARQ